MKLVLEDYVKIAIWWGEFFWCGKQAVFVLLGGVLPPPLPLHLQGFCQTVGLGEGVEQSIYGAGNKQDESRLKIFDKMGNIGGIIQENHSAADCFVLRNLGSIKKTLVKVSRFWPWRRGGRGWWREFSESV